MIVDFACKESIINFKKAGEVEEEKTEGDNAAAAALVTEKLMTCEIDEMMVVFMHGQLAKEQAMNPMEFSVSHFLVRQMPIYWQLFFE